MIKQVYAVITRINYAPLHIEIFYQQENAIFTARNKAHEESKSSLEPDSEIYGEIYGPGANTLVTKAKHLSFPNIIYAAIWGPTENIAFVSTLDIVDRI
jgi:hypothetical protein